ncbi:ATP-binding protein [Streptomyces sp. NPDC006482]|uniref:ATP-binding protein n=1 Tax=Streptomyces sp. NPDC006482 TaxID=3154306 RepID=UPI0033BBD5DA
MGPAPDETVVLRWRPAARSVPLARRELRRVLARWEWGVVEDVASLVLSELLTNAVRHGRVPGREVETHFAQVPGARLRIEVHDASERRPLMALPDGVGDGGWGLPLVDSLAVKWGVCDRLGTGKLVWAELAVKGESDAP